MALAGYRALSVGVMRHLANGSPLSRKQLASLANRHGAEPSAIASISQTSEWDDDDLVGHNGITLRKTKHRLEFSHSSLFAWCAYDPLFLIPIIGQPATLHTTCPRVGRPIEVDVAPHGVTGTRPESPVLSMVMRSPRPVPESAEEGQAAFCRYVHLLESRKIAQEWVPLEPEIVILEVDEGFRLGQMVYGDLTEI